MSETNQSEADAKRKAREEIINARIAELKKSEGKWYARNDGTGLPTLVKKYAGIYIKDGIGIYTFEVEIPGHAAWKPSATDFLAEHHEVGAPAATETSDLPH